MPIALLHSMEYAMTTLFITLRLIILEFQFQKDLIEKRKKVEVELIKERRKRN